MKRIILLSNLTLAVMLCQAPRLEAEPGGSGKGYRWRGGRGAGGTNQSATMESRGGPGRGAAQGQGQGQGDCGVAQEGEGEGTLTEKEREHLRTMREEERAARDLYAVFGEKYGLRIFDNIGSSEVRHMAAIKGLLDAYDLEDPSKDREPGSFADPRLQKAYDDLVRRGEKSLADALEASARFEEIDILDLQKAMEDTERTDLDRVFGNLERASHNHLRAFTRQLENRGVSRTAKHLEQSAVDRIISGDLERGAGADAP